MLQLPKTMRFTSVLQSCVAVTYVCVLQQCRAATFACVPQVRSALMPACVLQLCRAVEQWEPRTETVALHAWLHPWLPYLGPRMEELYPGIRFKLSTALQQWHPSDQSALALLNPWHTVCCWPLMTHTLLSYAYDRC